MKTNIKIRVNPEQSKIVQEICFENGFYWNDESKEIMNIYYSYLYIRSNLKFGDYEDKFKSCDLEEIDADLFIRTNGSCEERLIDNTENVYKGLFSSGFVKSALDKAVKEQCQKLSKEINEAQTFTMCKMENIQLKKKIENLHIALNKKVEKNKNQALEISLLLKQKEELKDQLDTANRALNVTINNSFNLVKLLENKDTIIKYLEDRLNEK